MGKDCEVVETTEGAKLRFKAAWKRDGLVEVAAASSASMEATLFELAAL